MATAGMRVESPLLQGKVYEAVKTEAKSVLPQMNIQYALTLQGRYEGAFEWLSVNYLNGNLTTGVETNGVLETGGGSYQMTWETSSKASNTIDVFSLNYGTTPTHSSPEAIRVSAVTSPGRTQLMTPTHFPRDIPWQVGR